MSYLLSWSGGKDCCFAYYKAMQQGLHISHLVNCISKQYQRVNGHGVVPQLICAQAEALGIPLVQQLTTSENYAEEFKAAIESVRTEATVGMVFGDIFLRDIKNWADEICASIGIEAIEPLWGIPTETIITDFIAAGFEAIIVSADAKLFSSEWLGKKLDAEFLSYLKTTGADICGENGEYHTLVIDGPIFHKRIAITHEKPILREGKWFLDVKLVKCL